MRGNWTAFDSDGTVQRLFKGSEPVEAELRGLSFIAGRFPREQYKIVDNTPVLLNKKEVADLKAGFYTPRTITTEWEIVRAERNIRLQNCDWTHTTDCPLSALKKDLWESYRQSLRNVTTQTDPFYIDWPVPPT